MSTHYTSFQIKNTAGVPMFLSFKDPDGNEQTVGPLQPGEMSIQLAPIGTSWTIKFVADDAQKDVKSPEVGKRSTHEADDGGKGESSPRP